MATVNYENSAVKNKSNNLRNRENSDLMTKVDEPAWQSGRVIGGDSTGLAARHEY